MFSSFIPRLDLLLPFFPSSSASRSTSTSAAITLPPVPTYPQHSSVTRIPTNTTTNATIAHRRLHHLLKLNHVNHAILFHHLQFHNHVPHILGSAYILGTITSLPTTTTTTTATATLPHFTSSSSLPSTSSPPPSSPRTCTQKDNDTWLADHLTRLYESEASGSGGLVPWPDSPGEVTGGEWREYLGRREYERAFVDFFEDLMVERGYEWRRVVEEVVFATGYDDEGNGGGSGGGSGNGEDGKGMLIDDMVLAGLGHPVIHLGYAYELGSREVAMEALAMAATSYQGVGHRFLDRRRTSSAVPETKESKTTTADPLEILARVRRDQRLDGAFTEPGGDNLARLFDDYEAVLLDHWNAWEIKEPKRQFELGQRAVIALLISAAQDQEQQQQYLNEDDAGSNNHTTTKTPMPKKREYDFFLLHLLTTSHALRILFPILPSSSCKHRHNHHHDYHHLSLLRQWFLLVIVLYIAQLRPQINMQKDILDYDDRRGGRGWDWVVQQALWGEHALDAHFVKGTRAMLVADQTWGSSHWGRRRDGEGEGEQGKGGEGDNFYLNAAVRFADEFDGWGGFSAEERAEMKLESKADIVTRH